MLEVDHFAFEVSNLDEAIRFYTELGLKLIDKHVDDIHHEAFAFFELEGGNLELVQVLDENNRQVLPRKRKVGRPYCPHVALKTENMAATVSMLKTKRVPIVKGPLEIPGKVKWLYICDPDNNIIEFVEWV